VGRVRSELDFADAAAGELDVVRALGVPGRALGRVLADLPVQRAQRLEHVVVQIAAEHEGQHHPAQGGRAAAGNGAARRHHAAFEPGKALPFPPLHQKVFLQRPQRDGRRAGVAVGPQRQVHAKDLAMLGRLADERVNPLDRFGKVFVVADAMAPDRVAGGFAVVVIDVDQVDVAGDVELASAEFAHANDPEFGAAQHGPLRRGHGGVGVLGRAVQVVELAQRLGQGFVQRQLGQCRHRASHQMERGLALGVEHGQPLQHQMAQHPQGAAQVEPARAQRLQGLAQRSGIGRARRQGGQLGGVAPSHALDESGMGRGIDMFGYKLNRAGCVCRGAGRHNFACSILV
jgi:hypothetical protein